MKYLVEIIKFIIQRKIFVILYESYINHAIFQQYSVAFSFFVAICKQYPFRKLEEYYNYKTYNYTFRQLLRPFNRRNFKYFLDCFHMRKKIEYLVVLLTKMIKFKSMERIFIYGQYSHEDDEEVAFKLIIMKIMNTLIRPHLYEAFVNLRNNLYQNYNDNSEDNNKEEENKDDSEVNFNISDDDDNMNINNYFNDLKNQINENNLEKTENSNLNLISKELYPYENRLNRSFTAMYENEEWKDIPVYNINEIIHNKNLGKNYKKHKSNKTTLI